MTKIRCEIDNGFSQRWATVKLIVGSNLSIMLNDGDSMDYKECYILAERFEEIAKDIRQNADYLKEGNI